MGHVVAVLFLDLLDALSHLRVGLGISGVGRQQLVDKGQSTVDAADNPCTVRAQHLGVLGE